MDAGSPDMVRAAELGADRIELYTGPYAEAQARGDASAALARCADSAAQAQAAGLGVNAGHDLSQTNLGLFLGFDRAHIAIHAGEEAAEQALPRIRAALERGA